jgi:adenine deaminase
VHSDHESTSIDEVLEKLRLGMYIMIREGSVTKNLRDLLPVITCDNLSRCFFVTDDRHPKDLLEKGHIDHMVKMAVKEGLDPISAIRMATINTAQYFGLKDLGAIAPGYIADLVVVDSLKRLNVRTVFKSGRVVARDGEMVMRPPAAPELTLRSSINIKWLAPSDFDIPAEGKRVRVINLVPDQIVTEATVERAKIEDGFVVADIERDVLKIAVVERHLASDNIGHGLVRGFGLKKGAIASSVSHDSHNIVVVGTSSEDHDGRGRRDFQDARRTERGAGRRIAGRAAASRGRVDVRGHAGRGRRRAQEGRESREEARVQHRRPVHGDVVPCASGHPGAQADRQGPCRRGRIRTDEPLRLGGAAL